jgi:hypothetical protein
VTETTAQYDTPDLIDPRLKASYEAAVDEYLAAHQAVEELEAEAGRLEPLVARDRSSRSGRDPMSDPLDVRQRRARYDDVARRLNVAHERLRNAEYAGESLERQVRLARADATAEPDLPEVQPDHEFRAQKHDSLAKAQAAVATTAAAEAAAMEEVTSLRERLLRGEIQRGTLLSAQRRLSNAQEATEFAKVGLRIATKDAEAASQERERAIAIRDRQAARRAAFERAELEDQFRELLSSIRPGLAELEEAWATWADRHGMTKERPPTWWKDAATAIAAARSEGA